MNKIALITGITGQDGSYLAELLLGKGYTVHGIIRRASSFNTGRIDRLYADRKFDDRLFLHHGDLTDSSNLNRIIERAMPDEIYNLGAQSHVKVSFDAPEYTSNSIALASLRLLDALKEVGLAGKTKFFQASSASLYGDAAQTPQGESAPFSPRSPYAAAEQFAYWTAVNYREAYGIFASNGILFNHESERRGETFVTRKITRAAGRIKLGLQDKLVLGDLDARRDWGYAPEYAEGIWRIMQAEKPDEYVLATGESHTVREFAQAAFARLGMEIEWRGSGESEKGVSQKTGETLIEVNPRYFRPSDAKSLLGDPSKAWRELGWKAETKFRKLAEIMADADFELAKAEAKL
ncbi:MAG: GDP-mannose 4,6-dehydratase [Verrucomicrobia bacterium CAG:312_58_20]|nr:MAG: GDP-mannose 4,6-dehydratase [Verrucomicrobia bacterium CAG:312_58_20]PWL69739.1 MAG: GDP-mannose 4,6-dehydratase [Verrucomicrobiota bacterium]